MLSTPGERRVGGRATPRPAHRARRRSARHPRMDTLLSTGRPACEVL